MKNKKLLTNQELAILALSLAVMFALGQIFERMEWGKLTFTQIKLNPVEGLIIIPLTLMGIKGGLLVGVGYLLLMAITGIGFNTTPAGIGFVAMAIALFAYIGGYKLGALITRPFCIKEPLRGYINLIVATLVVTFVMVMANFLFITPSFALQKFSWYTDMKATWGMSSGDIWEFVLSPTNPTSQGGLGAFFVGAVHGNLMKYGLASFLAATLLSNNKIWKFKTAKSKSRCRVKLKKPL